MIEEGRGSKRILHDRVDSPSKKKRNIQTLLKKLAGPGGVEDINKPVHTYMNATQPASDVRGSQTKTYFVIYSVDLDEAAKSKSEMDVDPTYGGER